MTDTNNPDWWREHDNVVTVAYWMKEHGFTVDDFVTLIEKPWKYADEYEEAVAAIAAEEAEAEAAAGAAEVTAAIGTQEAEAAAGLIVGSKAYKEHKEQQMREQEFLAGFEEGRP